MADSSDSVSVDIDSIPLAVKVKSQTAISFMWNFLIMLVYLCCDTCACLRSCAVFV